jgi:hypothetical protein
VRPQIRESLLSDTDHFSNTGNRSNGELEGDSQCERNGGRVGIPDDNSTGNSSTSAPLALDIARAGEQLVNATDLGIDWCTVTCPFPNLKGDRWVEWDQTGSWWQNNLYGSTKTQFSEAVEVLIRFIEFDQGYRLIIEFNPSSGGDLVSWAKTRAVIDFAHNKAASMVSLVRPPEDLTLSRLDITCDVDRVSGIDTFIQQAERGLKVPYKKTWKVSGPSGTSTLYVGTEKAFVRIYNRSKVATNDPATLRVELQLDRKALKKAGLDTVGDVTPALLHSVYHARVDPIAQYMMRRPVIWSCIEDRFQVEAVGMLLLRERGYQVHLAKGRVPRLRRVLADLGIKSTDDI